MLPCCAPIGNAASGASCVPSSRTTIRQETSFRASGAAWGAAASIMTAASSSSVSHCAFSASSSVRPSRASTSLTFA